MCKVVDSATPPEKCENVSPNDNYGFKSMVMRKPSKKVEHFLDDRCDIPVPMAILLSEISYPSPPESIYSPDTKVVGSWSIEDGGCQEDGQTTQSPNQNSVRDNGPVQKSSASTKPVAQPAIPKRKSRGIASSRGSNSNSDDEGSSLKRQCHGSAEPRIPLLACPFYKRDPHKYQDCLSYQLRRIKDVKQHVYRKHSKPEFYCSRCFQIFSTASDRDLHTRPASCEMHTDPQYDGITTEQKKALAIYVNRGKRLEDQWYDTYDIIFPSEARPKSVYVGNYFEEVIPLLRTFWDTRQSGIISNIAESGYFDGGVDQGSINAIMNTVFDQFEESIDGAAPEQESLSNTGLDASHVETPYPSHGNSFHEIFPEFASPQPLSNEMVPGWIGQSSVGDMWPLDSAYPVAIQFGPFSSTEVGENTLFQDET
ncbi:hypothetical protein V8E51_016556 [Hyaloscypha variabilis]